MTALHVAKICNYRPLIDLDGHWTPSEWQTIGIDEHNDLAVLQRVGAKDQKIATLRAKYGRGNVTFGSTALALGFPKTTPPIVFTRMPTQGPTKPFPMGVLAASYPSVADHHFIGAYVNRGFSGGPIVEWAKNHATITGIITHKGITETPSGENEHAGLIRVTNIAVAERIIARHKGLTIEQFRDGKPKPIAGEGPDHNPVSLMRREIIDAVIRLGTLTK